MNEKKNRNGLGILCGLKNEEEFTGSIKDWVEMLCNILNFFKICAWERSLSFGYFFFISTNSDLVPHKCNSCNKKFIDAVHGKNENKTEKNVWREPKATSSFALKINKTYFGARKQRRKNKIFRWNLNWKFCYALIMSNK